MEENKEKKKGDGQTQSTEVASATQTKEKVNAMKKVSKGHWYSRLDLVLEIAIAKGTCYTTRTSRMMVIIETINLSLGISATSNRDFGTNKSGSCVLSCYTGLRWNQTVPSFSTGQPHRTQDPLFLKRCVSLQLVRKGAVWV